MQEPTLDDWPPIKREAYQEGYRDGRKSAVADYGRQIDKIRKKLDQVEAWREKLELTLGKIALAALTGETIFLDPHETDMVFGTRSKPNENANPST